MDESWVFYERANDLFNRRQFQDAIDLIASARSRFAGTFSPIFVLEATCYRELGRPAEGLGLLDQASAFDRDNFWIPFLKAELLRQTGQFHACYQAYREAHGLIGWPESAAHGYELTHDYFSPNIPKWTGYFGDHIRQAPIDCIEIGSWQGGSAAWLLDKVVGPRGGSLTCIDTFEGSSEHVTILGAIGRPIEKIFDGNIAKTGRAHLVRKIKGYSQVALRPLPVDSYDFIYIDGAHEAKFVIQDACLTWDLLRRGGFMLFDDVPFTFPHDPTQDTVRAVDFFMSVFGKDVELIDRERQLLLRKR